jgi:SAM-dependent methyltransferase
MTQHSHQQHSHHQHSHQQHSHQHAQAGHDEAGLAELLDLDAEVLGPYLEELTGWAAQHGPDRPRTVVDMGAGTGTGTMALARRFPAAEVIAIDSSAFMLERLRAAATVRGPADRLRVVQADLDLTWPEVGAVDVVWAALSLHHVADPDRVLRDVHGALNPGGVLVVVEMDSQMRFLPDDLGMGRPGLEVRCHDVMAQAGWNAHPDWRPHLERAGFEMAAQRSFTFDVSPVPPSARRYAHNFLRRTRSALDGQLADDDLDTLDRLLADDGPEGVLHRDDLTVRGSRTVWIGRRP